MNAIHRLHNLRMENDAARFAMDEMRPRFEALRNRHDNGTAPVAVTAFQLFQTPPDLASRLVALAGIKPEMRVLEPSAGLGRLLDAVADYRPAEVVAVEIAPQCAAQLYRREAVTLKQRNFLAIQPEELGLFDAVVMNPPFHRMADIRHIDHASRFLNPGATLAALCLDTHHRETALRGMASTWEKIPAGTFKHEGTTVPCVLLTMRN